MILIHIPANSMVIEILFQIISLSKRANERTEKPFAPLQCILLFGVSAVYSRRSYSINPYIYKRLKARKTLNKSSALNDKICKNRPLKRIITT